MPPNVKKSVGLGKVYGCPLFYYCLSFLQIRDLSSMTRHNIIQTF